MIKAEVKVRSELTDDLKSFESYLQRCVIKINNDYGRNFSLHSWQVDAKINDEFQNIRTVELLLK